MYCFEKPIRLSIMGALILAFSLSVVSTAHAGGPRLHPNFCVILPFPVSPPKKEGFIELPNPFDKKCKIGLISKPESHPHVYDFCSCPGHDKWGIALKLRTKK